MVSHISNAALAEKASLLATSLASQADSMAMPMSRESPPSLETTAASVSLTASMAASLAMTIEAEKSSAPLRLMSR